MKRFPLFFMLIAGLAILSCPVTAIASASEQETELFNKGYEYLFSYKPDKAAETFRMFLKEYPESSARDAAMFWLGKTLISMKSYSEAEQTFQTIQKEFPDSPFLVFIGIEMEEIVRLRSAALNKDNREASLQQKDGNPKEVKDGKRSGEADRKLTQLQTDKEKAEALLEEERRVNRERMLRITDLESGEALLKKQNTDLEVQVLRLADLEKNLKEARSERDRLNRQIARLSAEKSSSEKDTVITTMPQPQEQKAAVEGGEPLRFRLAQLELLSEEQGKELARARKEQERLERLVMEEKKLVSELKTDLARSKEREKGDNTASSGRDAEKLVAEVNTFKGQVSGLQAENKNLGNRIEEMELQAEQRIRDMRILNAYLSRLMFQKKDAPKPQTDPKAGEERDRLKSTLEEEKKRSADLSNQLAKLKERPAHAETVQERPSSLQLASDALVRIGSRDYPLAQIIDYQITASLMLKSIGARDIAWRTGNPLNDFISEELLLMEARKINLSSDTKKQKEMIEKYRLGTAEAAYLEKVMTIARYLDTQYTDSSPDKWLELISVDYKPGDAASKTVLATDIQKAARGGTSFEEIAKMYPEGVRFIRLSIKEFSTKYKDKSQIIQKLNFLNEETVVMWSELGYMLIKPVSTRTPFNPFEELASEKKERLTAFLKQWFSEHTKQP
ncbi:MAG: tetratricopeptide repeat protein [Nitrospirae bacterium]|nr:tetratricopeptide repeat protein [Nitrospirota bacterium]